MLFALHHINIVDNNLTWGQFSGIFLRNGMYYLLGREVVNKRHNMWSATLDGERIRLFR